jgi:hypothetical protein
MGDPSGEADSHFASFSYHAQKKTRRVVAKVEWHPGELYPRVGFIVTNLVRPAERVVAFYNQCGTAEQWIREGKGAIRWTRLSCGTFATNAVRLRCEPSSAVQRFGTVNRPLRPPFTDVTRNLPLSIPLSGAILGSKPEGSGECRLT